MDSAWTLEPTTVVLRGLPKRLNAETLLGLLDANFLGCYDYFYLPLENVERLEGLGLGEAYINFRSHEAAVVCQRYFTGFTGWPGGFHGWGEGTCRGEWSSIQGLEANIEKQRQADWVNCNVPEDCKPMVFDEQGIRLPTREVFLDRRGWGSSKGDQWTKEWYGSSSKGLHSYPDRWSDWRKDEWSEWSRSPHPWSEPSRHREVDETTLALGPGMPTWELEDSQSQPIVEMRLNVHEIFPKLFSLDETVGADSSSVNSSAVVGAANSSAAPTSWSVLGEAKYACPSCGACFAKWSACQHHIIASSSCQCPEITNMEELQEVCKRQVISDGPDIDPTPFHDNEFVDLRLFQ